jgi:hypothetical protein
MILGLLFMSNAVAWCAEPRNAAEEALAAESRRVEMMMPARRDFCRLWWADGFPGHHPEAKWWRVIETGRYAFVLDTQHLTVPHFGLLEGQRGYVESAAKPPRDWRSLTAAQLELRILANGESYRCVGSAPWSNFVGPRIVESGRFLQRADVTGLRFADDEGRALNVEARFETVAWPDRLCLLLAVRPGLAPIPAGDTCFGRLNGGFGLNGSNHLEISQPEQWRLPRFTLAFWGFLPVDYQASHRTYPWLVCTHGNEHRDGHFGICLLNGIPRATMNIGGGPDNLYSLDSPRSANLERNAWHHFAISYDGATMRLDVDGEPAGDVFIGRARDPVPGGVAFGRRQDNFGDGYHLRGVIDEVHLYDHALAASEIKNLCRHPDQTESVPAPIKSYCFNPHGKSSKTQQRESWKDFSTEIKFASGDHSWSAVRRPVEDPGSQGGPWCEASLTFRLDGENKWSRIDQVDPALVEAWDLQSRRALPVLFDQQRDWYQVSLDGVKPLDPTGLGEVSNDAMERVRLSLQNPTAATRSVRLLFEKKGSGIRQRMGVPISGMSAVLRDADGYPIGIPVQISKNWHTRPEGGVYRGVWFHGASQLRLPPQSKQELELSIVYGHWGGVPAASHAQLCLIGWGSNQLWNQSAIGAWGESICYEPDQVQADCAILDVRPLMVRSMHANREWNWTHNVGGGDFFRTFDVDGGRVYPRGMRTTYVRQGPCLTEVAYAGRTGEALTHSATVSLARSDDMVRGTYHVRLDVDQEMETSRLVIFQVGADTYSYTAERKLAVGNEQGMKQEWLATWGGGKYRTAPIECAGRIPWVSLHDAVPRQEKDGVGAWANRGIVVRHWKARLGGKPATPWIAEFGVNARGRDTSTMDFVLPPDVNCLLPGDFVEATFQHLVVPQSADDYYGPNEDLRRNLREYGNSWQVVYRDAIDNQRILNVTRGHLERLYPSMRIRVDNRAAELAISKSTQFLPITFAGLTSYSGHEVFVDQVRLDQSVHGKDYWQTDYDPVKKKWELTFNLPPSQKSWRTIRFVAAGSK